MTKLDELVSRIGSNNVVIQTHNFPDPDAIASAFGLQYLLSTRKIPSDIVYFGKIDKFTFRLMADELHITTFPADEYESAEDDYVINVDGQRNSANFTDLTGHEIACIDHPGEAFVTISDPPPVIGTAGSSVTMRFRFVPHGQ